MSTKIEEVQEVPEVQEPVPEVVAEEVAVAAEPEITADEAMQQGFDAVNGIEAPAPEPEPVPEPKLFAGYTEEQIKEMAATVEALKQREQKLFGSMGAMKQSIDALRNQPQQTPVVRFSPDKFKRLSAEYPELANLLSQDLGEMSTSGDPQQIEQLVEQRIQTSLDKANQAYEAKLLTLQHRDWKQVVAAEDFVGWKESLPAEEKEQLDTSWDATFIGEKISQFKEWKSKTVQTKQTNQKRLEAAIAPKSSSSIRPAPTENDAFMAGFQSVRGA